MARNRVFDDAERVVGITPIEIWRVPSSACDGQMDFLNVGATTIAIRLGRNQGETGKEACNPAGPYTFLLAPGCAFSEDGLVLGSIIACSSTPNGLLSTKVTYC